MNELLFVVIFKLRKLLIAIIRFVIKVDIKIHILIYIYERKIICVYGV